MSTTIGGVRIVDMPDLGAITDDSSVVGEHAGSGRFAATAFRTYVANAGTGNIGRNLLHNPLFNVAQRGSGPWSTLGALTYTADRWIMFSTAGSPMSTSVFVVTDAHRAAIGDEAAASGLIATFTGSAASGSVSEFAQRIEDVRRLAGKTATVSFWAWTASGTTTLGLTVAQNFGSGGSPSAATSTTLQTIAITPTPARYSATFSIPSAAGKTLGTNRDDNTQLNIWLSAAGDTLPGAMGVRSGTVAIWGVQLEAGADATPLEKPGPRYDLSNCQRFYQPNPSIIFGNQAGAGVGVTASAPFITEMRAAPTLTVTINNCINMSPPVVTANLPGFWWAQGTVTATGQYTLSLAVRASADL